MKTHPMRWDALVFGVLFVLALAAWAAVEYELVSLDALAVSGPVALILAGIAGIALTLRRKS